MSSSSRRKRAQRKVVDKFKLKSWYQVQAAPYITDQVLGETIADDPQKLYGRVIEMAKLGILDDIIADLNLKVRFKIVNVEGTICRTEFVGHEISKEQIRSHIRRNRSRIESIQNVTTKDKAKLRISTIIVTPMRCGTSTQKIIRKAIQEYIDKKAKEENFQTFVLNIVNRSIASEVETIVNKIYPTILVEIRKSKVLAFPGGKTLDKIISA
ncbi:MAG: 30S ribosomal protein S3ae [Candidatus Heimdallarchaeum endolithica]|uniref:Small ribosomal subunit protein eS1 n=1 Tax=Candidatus Heimdallarchaeum endolithica TaxID=2876572 RepID=A0A9Y1FN71_9ARCH|nr:MAG: 30S ribosomal protein S3ae [Candidatus Heimdallarchaeum endolithica]